MFFGKRWKKIESELNWLKDEMVGIKAAVKDIPLLKSGLEKQGMALEDILESIQDIGQSDGKDNDEKNEHEKSREELLALISSYEDKFWDLKRMAQEIPEWNEQTGIMERMLERDRQICGIDIIGQTDVKVDYGLHEVIEVKESDDYDKDQTVAAVFRCGIIYKGKVIRKAQIVAYKYRKGF
ncbi:MAG: nucleotide exchange factor GrpE [Lachnospiraceae bacterium]|nr:nucleotide exchange factor GrpE [Lachnospiraceae bacterium]